MSKDIFFEKTSVAELKGSDFHDDKPWLLKSEKCSFVLFYAPWCGHCQNIKKDYKDFGDMCQFVKVCALNTEKEKKFVEKLNSTPKTKVKIVSFPTIWIYKNGEPFKEYKGERTLAAFCKKAMEICNAKCNCDKNN